MGVTLQTVADAVGVSRSTVSNAYNRPDQLTSDLRERILLEASRLGYAGPDAAARCLRSGRTGAIGLLFTETLSYAFSDPYAVGFLQGLAEVAERHGTSLLLVPIDPSLDPTDQTRAMDAVRQAVVDGFCLYCVDDSHPAVDVIRSRGLPVVTTDEPSDPESPYVGIDDRGAARSVAEHLARLGHERVAVVLDRYSPLQVVGSMPFEHAVRTTWREARLRLLGYRDALPNAEISVVTAARNSRPAAREAAAEVLDRRDRPTAVLATSDVLAFGVLDAVRQRGLTPGRDISVVGFDDVPAAADMGLTTVRQPMVDRGRHIGRVLLEPDTTEPRVRLSTELVVRTSSGPALP